MVEIFKLDNQRFGEIPATFCNKSAKTCQYLPNENQPLAKCCEEVSKFASVFSPKAAPLFRLDHFRHHQSWFHMWLVNRLAVIKACLLDNEAEQSERSPLRRTEKLNIYEATENERKYLARGSSSSSADHHNDTFLGNFDPSPLGSDRLADSALGQITWWHICGTKDKWSFANFSYLKW